MSETTETRGQTACRYDILALDLDGTLLGPESHLPESSVRAVRRAMDAGLRVLISTGRGWAETSPIAEALGVTEPVIVSGGAMAVDPASGETIHISAVDEQVASSAAETILDAGVAVIVLKDRNAAGYDYLVVRRDGIEVDPVTQWWFDKMDVGLRYAERLDEDDRPDLTIRVGACLDADRSEVLAAEMGERFEARALLHSFPAVVHCGSDGRVDGRLVHVLEVFDIDADKWSAVRRVADVHGVSDARIAAIGDESNDVTMVRQAGLGVAMANATPAVSAVANRTTRSNLEGGVEHAVDRILAGEW